MKWVVGLICPQNKTEHFIRQQWHIDLLLDPFRLVVVVVRWRMLRYAPRGGQYEPWIGRRLEATKPNHFQVSSVEDVDEPTSRRRERGTMIGLQIHQPIAWMIHDVIVTVEDGS